MKFKEISHSQSLETVDTYGLKHWYKSGVTIEIESQDEVDRAAKLAEQFVNEQLDKYKMQMSFVAGNSPVPEMQVDKGTEDLLLASAKAKILEIETKDAAEKWAEENGWKYNLEIKSLINQKTK